MTRVPTRLVDVVFVGGPVDGKSARIPTNWLEAGVTFCAYGLTAEDEGPYILDRPHPAAPGKQDSEGRYVYREYEGTAIPTWLTSNRKRVR